MADIFLSYARGDRERVKRLVEIFQGRGWTVWWDPVLLAGQRWSDLIEQALDSASCVVVLWSLESVKSTWVKREAREGSRRDILAPALLDAVRIPLEFRDLHTVDLTSWDAAEVENLCASVANTLQRTTKPHPAMAAGATVRAEAEVLRAGDPRVHPVDGLTYVWIPPGRFVMGAPSEDTEASGNERPAHEVTITHGFWMGQTPVTQAAWQRVMGGNPSEFKGADRPVDSVTWEQAVEYCRKVGMRLPTEAEWEYAARAGSRASRYGPIDEIAWYRGNSGRQTHPVKQKKSNEWGLRDTLGNVWEWVAGWYGDYSEAPLTDPMGPTEGSFQVLRGGSWYSGFQWVRVSYRCKYLPTTRNVDFGFRCAGDFSDLGQFPDRIRQT